MASEFGARRNVSRVALIEAGSPGLNIYSHVAMGRGVPLLATVVRRAGYDVKVFVEDISGKDSIDWDYVKGAQVIGFSAITCTLPRTMWLIERAREVNPSAAIVLGGPEPTCSPARAFAAGADFVVRGEGEAAFMELLHALNNGLPVSGVSGVSWREMGAIVHNAASPQLTKGDLDGLPAIDYSLIHEGEKRSVASVWRSRGCPQRCDFCEVWQIWPRYVARDDAASVQELLAAQEAGFELAFLIDDNAAGNKASFKRFLQEAIDAGYRGHLVVQLRADVALNRDGSLDRELLRLLRDVASSTIVCIGVESADDGNLKRMEKRIDARAMQKALRAMRRYGLVIHGMMIALTGDTPEIIRKNGDFAVKNLSTLQYLFETPLPGTIRTAQHEKANRFLFDELADLAYCDGMHVVLRPDRMSPSRMQDEVIEQYKRFYSPRRVAWAFVRGLMLRHRHLSPAQKRFLRQLPTPQRFYRWLRFHLEFKLVEWSVLAIGKRRVRDFMRDPEYAAFRKKLDVL